MKKLLQRPRFHPYRTADVVAIIGIIAAIAVPACCAPVCPATKRRRLFVARHPAESTFSSSCGGNGYAQSLRRPRQAADGFDRGFRISPDLSKNGITKSGYLVNLAKDTGAEATSPPRRRPGNELDGGCGVGLLRRIAPGDGWLDRSALVRHRHTRGTIHLTTPGATMAAGLASGSVLQ